MEEDNNLSDMEDKVDDNNDDNDNDNHKDDDHDSMDSMPAFSQRSKSEEIHDKEYDLCQGDLCDNINFHEERELLVPSETNVYPPAEVSKVPLLLSTTF